MNQYHFSHGHIDHIAIAVSDLDDAINMYQNIFGFRLLGTREISGTFSGMKSAEFDAGAFAIVLVQGTDHQSQVSKYIEKYGPGVQHIAIAVDDVEHVSTQLKNNGVKFATDIIRGRDLLQIFTEREENTGMMFEYIQRLECSNGFEAENIQKLFEQLESREAY